MPVGVVQSSVVVFTGLQIVITATVEGVSADAGTFLDHLGDDAKVVSVAYLGFDPDTGGVFDVTGTGGVDTTGYLIASKDGTTVTMIGVLRLSRNRCVAPGSSVTVTLAEGWHTMVHLSETYEMPAMTAVVVDATGSQRLPGVTNQWDALQIRAAGGAIDAPAGTWLDHVGGNDLVATGDERPDYVAGNGSNAPRLDFDGVDDHLITESAIATDGAFTCGVAFSMHASAGDGNHPLIQKTATVWLYAVKDGSDLTLRVDVDVSESVVSFQAPLTTNARHVVACKRDGTSLKVWINGILTINETIAAGFESSSIELQVGTDGSSYFHGSLYAVAFATEAVTDIAVAGWNSMLQDRVGRNFARNGAQLLSGEPDSRALDFFGDPLIAINCGTNLPDGNMHTGMNANAGGASWRSPANAAEAAAFLQARFDDIVAVWGPPGPGSWRLVLNRPGGKDRCDRIPSDPHDAVNPLRGIQQVHKDGIALFMANNNLTPADVWMYNGYGLHMEADGTINREMRTYGATIGCEPDMYMQEVLDYSVGEYGLTHSFFDASTHGWGLACATVRAASVLDAGYRVILEANPPEALGRDGVAWTTSFDNNNAPWNATANPLDWMNASGDSIYVILGAQMFTGYTDQERHDIMVHLFHQGVIPHVQQAFYTPAFEAWQEFLDDVDASGHAEIDAVGSIDAVGEAVDEPEFLVKTIDVSGFLPVLS